MNEDMDDDQYLQTFPGSLMAPRESGQRYEVKIYIGDVREASHAVNMLAHDMWQKIMNRIRSARRGASDIRWDNFDLSIDIRGTVQEEGKVPEVFFRHFAMGTYMYEDGNDNIEKLIDELDSVFNDLGTGDQVGVMIESGAFKSLYVDLERYRCNLVDMNWGIVGSCLGKDCRITDQATGMRMKQFKSKAGDCGLKCIMGFIKANKVQMDTTKFDIAKPEKVVLDNGKLKRAKSIKRLTDLYNELALKAGIITTRRESNIAWQARELKLICDYLAITLIVYDVMNLAGDHIFPPEGVAVSAISPLELTLRLAWCGPSSPYNDGESGHYLLMEDTHIRCVKKDGCGEIIDRTTTKRHRCKLLCEECHEKYTLSSTRHRCATIASRLASEMEERKDNEIIISDSLEARRERMRREVDDIVEGKVCDDEALLQWNDDIQSGNNVCLIGDAGTGKSWQTGHLIEHMITQDILKAECIAVCSAEAIGITPYKKLLEPYGVRVSTIHSLLSWRVGCKVRNRSEQIRDNKKLIAIKERLCKLTMLVIDEVGCCATDWFCSLSMSLQIIRRNAEPFGGLQLLITGDFRQRPPITMTEPIFMSDLWSRMNIKYSMIRQQRRVNNDDDVSKRFLRTQMTMARGICSSEDLDWLNRMCWRERVAPASLDMVHLVMTNKLVYSTGIKIMQELYGDDFTKYHIKAMNEDDVPPNELSPSMMTNFDLILHVRVGVPVMFTGNQYIDFGAGNGTIGTVVSLHTNVVSVELEDGALIDVTRVRIGQKEKKLGAQFPLRLAFARTIHKSQGATMKKVCVHLSTKRMRNGNMVKIGTALMYVAVSRVKSIHDLTFIGVRMTKRMINVCARSIMFTDMIVRESYEKVNTMIRLSFAGKNDSKKYPFNMQVDNHLVSIADKSVHNTKTLYMYSREEYDAIKVKDPRTLTKEEKDIFIGNFNEVIYFDFETCPVGNARVQEPYHVYMRYWNDYKVEQVLNYGVKTDGGIEDVSVIKKFCDTIMDIAQVKTDKWIQSRYKKEQAPIRLVAYNGSGFDNAFIMRYMQQNCTKTGLEYNVCHKNSKMITFDIIYTTEDGHSKTILSCWDPCLVIMNTLDEAHKDFCPEQHANVHKGVYPHKWIGKVGVEEAFAEEKVHEIDINSGFPYNMRSQVRNGIEKGILKSGSAPDSVLFNPVRELHKYVYQDVHMLENVVEKISLTIWNDILPESNIPVWKFATSSALGFYATIYLLDDEYIEENKSGDKSEGIRSKIHRLLKRHDRFCREGVYGGKTLNRLLQFISQQRDEIVDRFKNGTLTSQDYLDCTDALFYIDIVGMYHYIAQHGIYPYGREIELVLQPDIDTFFEAFMSNPTNPDFPMFYMRLDVYPLSYDLESSLPRRNKGEKRLLWDNEPRYGVVYNSVHLQLALKKGYHIEKPTQVILWGTKVAGVWKGTHAKLFEKSCQKWEKMRLLGGCMKDTGKAIACSGPFGGQYPNNSNNLITLIIIIPFF